tara:strand:+ start:1875 stop:1997 length:123 start_codon:yes stop_codon:yes gene_type:complete
MGSTVTTNKAGLKFHALGGYFYQAILFKESLEMHRQTNAP